MAAFQSPVADNAAAVAAVTAVVMRQHEQASGRLPAWPALDELAQTFDLSVFERDVLLLLFAIETSSELATTGAVTVQRALSLLPNAHLSAFEATRPLRRFQLVETSPGAVRLATELRIDERILWHLLGVASFDERLLPLVEVASATQAILPSHERSMTRIVDLLAASTLPPPVVMISGGGRTSRENVVVAAGLALGMQTIIVQAAELPNSVFDRERFSRLIERELALHPRLLLVENDDAVVGTALVTFIDRFAGPVVISSRERLQLGRRVPVTIELEGSTRDDRRSIWAAVLGDAACDGLERVIDQFDISADAARAVARELCGPDRLTATALWDACRAQLREPLDGAARRLDAVATWDDLVLPDAELQVLQAISNHIVHRRRVLDDWGFAGKTGRGLGSSALFWGPSGTGKTTAAEVLAHELELDLYHVDLSQIVSKYIGDTERNLRVMFDAAERAGAILLFDEADALFGRRGEVNDSHDRYANIEVSYLLQRMESYRGLAILTTNKKEAIDVAFLRRLRYVVHFAFPDVRWRRELWRRALPPTVPTDGIDFDQLSRVPITGGSIRNIALGAAFMAAGESGPVRMPHLARAARAELVKLGQPQAEAELSRWL